MKIPKYTEEEAYYLDLYRGKTLAFKVSGGEIASPEFMNAADQIKELIYMGVKFILVCGGGPQIDQEWRKSHPNTFRPKRHGVGITNEEIMHDAVKPAYQELRIRLHAIFGDMPNYIRPAELVARTKQDFVGEPIKIRGLSIHNPLNIVGFLGKEGDKFLNVNADEIIRTVIETHGDIDEVLIATPAGGVLNVERKIVPNLTGEEVQKIISGQHPSVKVDGGMLKKLREIPGLLELVPRVAMIRADQIKHELLHHAGAGTLCVRD